MTLDVRTDLVDEGLDAVTQGLDEAAQRRDEAATRSLAVELGSHGTGGASKKAREGGDIRRIPGLWGGRDLNPRPRDYESPALTG